jgi:hypothetical protein
MHLKVSDFDKPLKASDIIKPDDICSIYSCAIVHPDLEHSKYVRQHLSDHVGAS